MTDRHKLAEGISTCFECDEHYKSISRHWAHKPNHRPEMTQHQHEIIFGLILGGASVDTRNKTPAFKFRTQYRDFALYVAEQLGWLFGSLHRVPPMAGRGTHHAYTVRTRPHPEIERYVPWWDEGTLYVPEGRAIRRWTARIWYAKAAQVGWSGNHNSRESRFSAANEPRRSWMQYYLRELGYEPTYREGEWFITSTATRDLFGYIGGPVPGMEHKWALDRETYDAIRDEHREELERLSHWTDEPKVELSLYRPGTHQPEIPSAEPLLAQSDPGKQFSRVDCLRAIRKAGELVSEPLTTTVYERVRPLMVDAPSTSLISERFGWRELLFEAAGRPEGNKAKWSEWECAAAIAQFAAQTEQPWTIVKYNAFISDCEQRYPAAHTIVQRYGGWIAALKHLAAAGILHEELDQVRRHQQKWPDTEIKAAIREALEDQEDNTLVGEDYDEWRSRQPSPRPSRRTIIRRYGRWSDAVRLVGGNPGRQDDE